MAVVRKPVRRAARPFAGVKAKHEEIIELADIGGGRSGSRAFDRGARASFGRFVSVDPNAHEMQIRNFESISQKGFPWLRGRKDESSKSLSFDFSLMSKSFMRNRKLSPSEAAILTKNLLLECRRILAPGGLLFISTFKPELREFRASLIKAGFGVVSVKRITGMNVNSGDFPASDSARHYVFAEKKGFEPFMITARKK